MDNEYWISKIRDLEEQGKFDEYGKCPICDVVIRGDTAQETFLAQEKHANKHNSFKRVFTAYDIVESIVKPQGNGAHVSIPKSWLGKRVKVLLLEY